MHSSEDSSQSPKAPPKGSGAVRRAAADKAVRREAKKVARAEKAPEWIEIFPNTMSVSTNLGRPVLIFKDKTENEILPVWMHPLDAGLALAELSQGAGNSPHAVTRKVLHMAELKLETCAFTEIVGHHQFVELTFKTSSGAKTLRVRADEAMSFCLQARARFLATSKFMAQCRNLDEDLARFEQSLVQGQEPELLKELEKSSKKHPYVM